MNISNSLSWFLDSIQSIHSEHVFLQTPLYPVSVDRATNQCCYSYWFFGKHYTAICGGNCLLVRFHWCQSQHFWSSSHNRFNVDTTAANSFTGGVYCVLWCNVSQQYSISMLTPCLWHDQNQFIYFWKCVRGMWRSHTVVF